jgi:hypothetical protein
MEKINNMYPDIPCRHITIDFSKINQKPPYTFSKINKFDVGLLRTLQYIIKFHGKMKM